MTAHVHINVTSNSCDNIRFNSGGVPMSYWPIEMGKCLTKIYLQKTSFFLSSVLILNELLNEKYEISVAFCDSSQVLFCRVFFKWLPVPPLPQANVWMEIFGYQRASVSSVRSSADRCCSFYSCE